MVLPLFQLRTGVDLDEAIRVLDGIATNIHGEAQPVGATVPADRQHAYAQWTRKTEGTLRGVLPQTEIARIFSGARHHDICSMVPGNQTLPMITAEVDTLRARFEECVAELKRARELFGGAGHFLVPDTSFYIEHPDKLRDVDFHDLAQSSGSIRVVLPIVVVDELDGLKRNSKTRWRAGHSLGVLDEVVADPPAPGTFQPSTHNPPRGEVTLQILFDPPRHQRMPINDDEIVDRCVALQTFAGDVTVVTYDTGQSTRARAAGLKVMKLTSNLGSEPTTT